MTADLWPQALAQIKLQVTPADFETWIKGTCIVEQVNGRVVVGAPTPFARDWLENRLADLTRKTLAGLTGQPVEVLFILAPNAAPAPSKTRPKPDAGAPDQDEAQDETQTAAAPTGLITAEIVEYDPRQRGYTQVPNYDLLFWQPYLGPIPFK